MDIYMTCKIRRKIEKGILTSSIPAMNAFYLMVPSLESFL